MSRWYAEAATLGLTALLATSCGSVGASEPEAVAAPPIRAASTAAGPAVVTVAVGPGRVATTARHERYEVRVSLSPNRVGKPLSFTVRVTEAGRPVNATVDATVAMLDMQMGRPAVAVRSMRHGVLRARWDGVAMAGRYGIALEVSPPGGDPFVVVLVDTVT